jgi:hypothetical protein
LFGTQPRLMRRSLGVVMVSIRFQSGGLRVGDLGLDGADRELKTRRAIAVREPAFGTNRLGTDRGPVLHLDGQTVDRCRVVGSGSRIVVAVVDAATGVVVGRDDQLVRSLFRVSDLVGFGPRKKSLVIPVILGSLRTNHNTKSQLAQGIWGRHPKVSEVRRRRSGRSRFTPPQTRLKL